MAHKKAGGAGHNGRDSQPHNLGVKKYAGESVLSGTILVRQHGSQIHAGENVGLAKDFTLYATVDGIVKYEALTKDKRKVSVQVAK
jgi:large subunit ribosomal protein L27